MTIARRTTPPDFLETGVSSGHKNGRSQRLLAASQHIPDKKFPAPAGWGKPGEAFRNNDLREDRRDIGQETNRRQIRRKEKFRHRHGNRHAFAAFFRARHRVLGGLLFRTAGMLPLRVPAHHRGNRTMIRRKQPGERQNRHHANFQSLSGCLHLTQPNIATGKSNRSVFPAGLHPYCFSPSREYHISLA